MKKPHIGISACLLGEKVRFNGGHKKDNWITSTLAKSAEFTSFCPEVGIGLSVPRPTLRLVGKDNDIIAVDSDTQTKDVTQDLRDYFHRNKGLIGELDGYILMQGSPSCGMERVKLYGDNAMPEKIAAGIFAEELQKQFPNMPIEEAGRLNDSHLAESFLTRLFVYQQWREEKPYRSAQKLIKFHSQHKFLIMLHDYAGYRETGKLLSDLSDSEALFDIGEAYLTALMKSLKKVSSSGQRTNALLHLFGYLKNHMTSAEKHSLLELVESYRKRTIPYIVPLTVLRHYASLHQNKDPYLWQQSVWSPYPETLNQYKNTV
jgi:uncharacterized protein YbgA (DUF1722 family)/uncharacterized protein YbbK (DUF523 family)